MDSEKQVRSRRRSSILLWWCWGAWEGVCANPTPFSHMYSQLSRLINSSTYMLFVKSKLKILYVFTSSLFLFPDDETVNSGQNSKSETANNKVFASGVWSAPSFMPGSGFDQKNDLQSGSSKMKGMSLVSKRQLFRTVCCSVDVLQLESTALPNFSTIWNLKLP